MKFAATLDYEFSDTKKWLLLDGGRLLGDIVWYSTDNPEVKAKSIKPGYHLAIMDFFDDGKRYGMVEQGVFQSYDEAITRAKRWPE